MDGGIDDALGLILGLRSPEIEVVGITSVSGNVPVHQATLNALRVVELVDRRDVWVAEGLSKPLTRDPIRAFNFHGRDGLGDSHLPLPKLRLASKDALKMLGESLSSSKKHGLTIVCTGPLTNIASLLTKTPDVKRQIGEIVIMGGAYGITKYGIGNETPVAEFNIFSDPEAAKAVFESDNDLKTVGLDVTTIPRLELTANDYSRIRKTRGKIAGFATRILRRSIRTHGRFTLHDPMAVAVTISPSLYAFSEYHVSIETKGALTSGMTIADRRAWLPAKRLQGNKIKVCATADPGFKRLLLERLTVA
jgi:purine nucleosidase